MGKNSAISWTDSTWNPWRGCHKVTELCKNCYMFREQKRYGKDPNTVVRSKTTFNDPVKWKEPAKVFVCSWSDFWILEADGWREGAIDVMLRAPQHTYIIPTKRPNRARVYIKYYEKWHNVSWDSQFPNMWGLVSAGNQETADEFIPVLLQTPFAVRGVSVEPFLGPIDLIQSGAIYNGLYPGIDWVIIGVESASYKKVGRLGEFETESAWIDGAIDLVEQCKRAGVAVFVKQVPINGKVNTNPDDWPMELRIQEFPK